MARPYSSTTVRSHHSQAVQVNLGAHVLVAPDWRQARHAIVVVPAPEVFLLDKGAVVHLGVEVLRDLLVEYPVWEGQVQYGSRAIGAPDRAVRRISLVFTESKALLIAIIRRRAYS